jgi:predicted transposase/invertase (TIGR01784 family)
MEYTLERAIDEIERRGEIKGEIKGEIRGERKGKLETAKAALAKGFSVEDIADITGLDKETVGKLKADAILKH